MMSALSAKWFVRQIHHFGLAPGDLIKGTGLDSTWLAREDATISVDEYIRLVENALDKTGEPALGLKIGKWYNLQEIGIWGYAILSCATASEAMKTTFKYWELNGGLVNVDAQIREDKLIWDIGPIIHFQDVRLLMYSVEELLSTAYHALCVLFGKSIEISELHLSYPPPEHADLYHELAPKSLYFNAAKNLVITPADTLDMPTVSGHSGVKEVCEKQCQDLLRKLGKADQLTEEIRRVIVESMGRFPKADEVAAKLNISPRTLFRRLQRQGTTYLALLDEVRTELSMEYLEETNLSVDQISELIGFAETTTFRQTFKKWTGISPSDFRKKKSSAKPVLWLKT
jgi:AraC-like DNA-binding protein